MDERNSVAFCIVIPTLNAASHFVRMIPLLKEQECQPRRTIIIDSSSTDQTKEVAEAAGFQVHTIKRSSFNHGGTRNIGLSLSADVDVVLYLTQDALPSSSSTTCQIVKNFCNPDVDVAYGRQMPRENATTLEQFARLFNYPAQSRSRARKDIPTIGFKSTFCSNSFAAYRVSALRAVGGFPEDTIFGEDALAVAKMILSGSVVNYDAQSQVVHSHNYRIFEEFKRYFDIGVMHELNSELLKKFGSVDSTGRDFFKAEVNFVLKRQPAILFELIARTICKYSGYHLGKRHKSLGNRTKQALSMHRSYWARSGDVED